MPVTAAELQAFQAKIKALETQTAGLSDDVRREVLATVEEHRRKIKELIDHYPAKSTIPAADLPRLSQMIQDETNAMLADMKDALAHAQQGIFTKGISAGQELAHTMELQGSFFAPSTDLLTISTGYTADLVKSIGDDLMPKVNALLSRSVLGGIGPYETMQELDALLGRKGDSGVSFQAERIVRDNVQRVYSIALNAQVQQMTSAVENPDALEKEWLSGPFRPGRRISHQNADGQIVPVNEPFIITDDKTGQKIRLMYPRDPGGPAHHTIMCGCGWRIVAKSIKKAVGQG